MSRDFDFDKNEEALNELPELPEREPAPMQPAPSQSAPQQVLPEDPVAQPPAPAEVPAVAFVQEAEPAQNQGDLYDLEPLPAHQGGGSDPRPPRERRWPLWAAGLALVLVGSMLGTAMTLAWVTQVPVALAAPASDSSQPHSTGPAVTRMDSYEGIPGLYKQVAPSVVSVTVTSKTVVRGLWGEAYEQQQRGDGSGFIVDESGLILTNHHVISGATDILVRLYDGTELAGKVVGSDPTNDLALIQVDPQGAVLQPLPMGDSDATEIGDLVIAVGYPFRLPQSVTDGIISGKEREMEGSNLRNLLQTNAAINPGNSGGPLVNGRGEVIGVNTAIESPVRGFVGIGFAVPINTAKRILPTLKEGKEVQHPWIGVHIETVTEALAKQNNLPANQGVLVGLVVEGSPAEKAGLKSAAVTRRNEIVSADIITHVDGHEVRRAEDLIREVEKRGVGDTLALTVRRGEETMTINVTLEARPQATQ